MLDHVSPTVGSVLWRNGKVYPVRYGTIEVATAATHPLISAPGTGKSIVLLEMFAWFANTQTFKLQDSAGSPEVILPALTAGSGGLQVHLQSSVYGWRKLAQNVGLNLVTTAALVVTGMFAYIEVDE